MASSRSITEKGILNAPMNKKNAIRFLSLLAIAVLTSGCLRLASSTTVDLTQFTSQPSPSAQAETISAVPTLTATPMLDPATMNTLRTFPLWVGSTWVYDYLGYSQDEEVHWRVTDAVVSSSMLEGYYIVEVERKADLTLGSPALDFPSAPLTGTFYYLIDREKVYRFEGSVASDLDAAWLELVLPFPPDEEGWYPDPAVRSSADPSEIGPRFADGPFDQVVAESGTRICYNVVTVVRAGSEEATFCEGIGYVFWEADNGSGVGSRVEMIGFVLQ